MSDCIFCKIVEGKIPSTKIFEDEHVIGFKDLRPQAKIHQLFIHKKHTSDINHMAKDDPAQLAHLFNAIRVYTEKEHLTKEGFRIVTNQGPNAGQTVFHTHFHVLAGEPLGHFGS
jgi:histidine triad (HIT) family protein